MSDSMFSAAFDVLIKILKSYRPQIPSNSARLNPIARRVKGYSYCEFEDNR